MVSKEIKTRITPHFSLVIDMEDGKEPITWKLCPTYKAIAKIEEATGLDLKNYENWPKISSGKHWPAIVHGLLEKFNSDVTLDQVTEILNPEAQRLLSNAIFDLLFPGAQEAYEKKLAELEAAKDTGATASPNVQTGTPTV